MVALSGSGWRLAPSLIAYVREADRLYPNRDRSSDGSIGDLAHSSRESDHNPYDGWVHAVDLDEDIAPGTDLRGLAAHLLASRDPRIRYVIYEGRIFKSYVDPAGHAAWTWMPYTGPNAHTQHLHLSINRTDQARTDLRPWFPQASPSGAGTQPEDDMQPDERQELFNIGKLLTDNLPAIRSVTDALYTSGTVADVDRLDAVIGGNLPQIRAAADALVARDPVALANAIPDDLAQRVADELAKRLAG